MQVLSLLRDSDLRTLTYLLSHTEGVSVNKLTKKNYTELCFCDEHVEEQIFLIAIGSIEIAGFGYSAPPEL